MNEGGETHGKRPSGDARSSVVLSEPTLKLTLVSRKGIFNHVFAFFNIKKCGKKKYKLSVRLGRFFCSFTPLDGL